MAVEAAPRPLYDPPHRVLLLGDGPLAEQVRERLAKATKVIRPSALRTTLAPGDCVAFPKGEANGHHVVNRSTVDCTFLAMSGGADAGGEYSDIDMLFTAGGYTRKDGTPYPSRRVK